MDDLERRHAEGVRRRNWLKRWMNGPHRRRERPWIKYSRRGARPAVVHDPVKQALGLGRIELLFHKALKHRIGAAIAFSNIFGRKRRP
jgi:hypothetical protein